MDGSRCASYGAHVIPARPGSVSRRSRVFCGNLCGHWVGAVDRPRSVASGFILDPSAGDRRSTSSGRAVDGPSVYKQCCPDPRRPEFNDQAYDGRAEEVQEKAQAIGHVTARRVRLRLRLVRRRDRGPPGYLSRGAPRLRRRLPGLLPPDEIARGDRPGRRGSHTGRARINAHPEDSQRRN